MKREIVVPKDLLTKLKGKNILKCNRIILTLMIASAYWESTTWQVCKVRMISNPYRILLGR